MRQFANKSLKLFFCDSPYAAWKKAIQLRLKSRLNTEINKQLIFDLGNSLHNQVEWLLLCKVSDRMKLERLDIWMQVNFGLEEKLKIELKNELQLHTNLRDPWIKCQQWSFRSCWYDFCFYVLNCPYDRQKWIAQQSLVQHCSWILPYEKICIVSVSEAPPKEVRPTKLSFDNQNHLHAEAEPAIEFADGYSLYSYHGVTLPEEYGKIHPNQWKAQWLLEEDNAEPRRVLIQGIGYARICQELPAIELDTWQEYTILKIDAKVDEESIYSK